MTNPIASFWFGFSTPAKAFRIILSSKKLILLSIFPVVITLAVYVFLISQFQERLELQALERLHSLEVFRNAGFWTSLSEGLIRWLMRLVIFIFAAVSFSVTSNVLASPFQDFLAEGSEPFTTPPLNKVESSGLGHHIRVLGLDVLKSLLAGVGGILAFAISWIPLINLGALFMIAMLITFQYLSYPQTRRGMGVGASIGFLFKHLPTCLGFGVAFSFLLSIPLLSAFFMPLAVVGGTLIFARCQPK